VWRAYTGVIHYIFDQMSNLKISLLLQTKTYEGRGPQTNKHLSPSTFKVNFEENITFRVGFFIDIWSMQSIKEICTIHCPQIPKNENK
jgi:hypothetical protein